MYKLLRPMGLGRGVSKKNYPHHLYDTLNVAHVIIYISNKLLTLQILHFSYI